MKKLIDTLLWFGVFAISVFLGLKLLLWKNALLAESEAGFDVTVNAIVFVVAASGFIISYFLNRRMKNYCTSTEYIAKFSNLFIGYTSVIVFGMGILDYVYNKN